MNLSKDIFELLSAFLQTVDVSSLRTSSKRAYDGLTFIYFTKVMIDIKKLNNEDQFTYFIRLINKYKLCVKIKNVSLVKQLLRFIRDTYENSIEEIALDDSFNFELKSMYFPKKLKSLTFNKDFSRKIKKGILPEGLLKLKFDNWKEKTSEFKIIHGALPSNLTSLELCKFNQIIDENFLPSTLTHLNLGSDFNYPIYNLPPSLTNLDCGSIFNQELKNNTFPKGLKILNLGRNFNRHLFQGVFPEELEELDMGYYFWRNIDQGILPPNLKLLKLGGQFNFVLIHNVLPATLTNLEFGYAFNRELDIGVLPVSLKVLKFGGHYNKVINPFVLPIGLTSLTFENTYDYEIIKNVLPPTLEYLIFNNDTRHAYDQPYIQIGALPPLLKYLKFDKDFHQKLEVGVLPACGVNSPCGLLPQSLKILKFGYYYSQPLDTCVLPEGLLELDLGNNYNQEIKCNILPNSLQILRFGDLFDQKLDGVLPPNLINLRFGTVYNQEIKQMPSTIEVLEFGALFDQILDDTNLPANLIQLTISTKFKKLNTIKDINLKYI
jgi:hypothetical protein